MPPKEDDHGALARFLIKALGLEGMRVRRLVLDCEAGHPYRVKAEMAPKDLDAIFMHFRFVESGQQVRDYPGEPPPQIIDPESFFAKAIESPHAD